MYRSIQSENGHVESEKWREILSSFLSFYPVPANRSTPPVSLRRELEVRMNAYLPDPERVSGQRLARRVDDVIAEGHLDLTRRRPEQG